MSAPTVLLCVVLAAGAASCAARPAPGSLEAHELQRCREAGYVALYGDRMRQPDPSANLPRYSREDIEETRRFARAYDGCVDEVMAERVRDAE
ncbi:MAG: hypothetical protein MI723_00340 [Caulobacterales bacterium]|nr:hypothetical protein [Caulobacterales bacterium]